MRQPALRKVRGWARASVPAQALVPASLITSRWPQRQRRRQPLQRPRPARRDWAAPQPGAGLHRRHAGVPRRTQAAMRRQGHCLRGERAVALQVHGQADLAPAPAGPAKLACVLQWNRQTIAPYRSQGVPAGFLARCGVSGGAPLRRRRALPRLPHQQSRLPRPRCSSVVGAMALGVGAAATEAAGRDPARSVLSVVQLGARAQAAGLLAGPGQLLRVAEAGRRGAMAAARHAEAEHHRGDNPEEHGRTGLQQFHCAARRPFVSHRQPAARRLRRYRPSPLSAAGSKGDGTCSRTRRPRSTRSARSARTAREMVVCPTSFRLPRINRARCTG